jgi:hypothetical protein
MSVHCSEKNILSIVVVILIPIPFFVLYRQQNRGQFRRREMHIPSFPLQQGNFLIFIEKETTPLLDIHTGALLTSRKYAPKSQHYLAKK